MNLFKSSFLVVFATFMLGCPGGEKKKTTTDTNYSDRECTQQELQANEIKLRQKLASLPNAEFPHSVLLGSPDGREFSYDKGSVNQYTLFHGMSVSKWVSASIILKLVELGVGGLTLDSYAKDYIPEAWWPKLANDARSRIKLRHLLNFTSGLEQEHLCQNNPNFALLVRYNYVQCVEAAVQANQGLNIEPGTTYHYNTTHLQVAGMMAIRALGVSSWQQVFDYFRNVTRLFPQSNYAYPTTAEPNLAAGLYFTTRDYFEFLKAMRDDRLFERSFAEKTAAEIKKDNPFGVTIRFTTGFGPFWRYGYGFWLEGTAANQFSIISSPGAFGAYPFVNVDEGYFGVIGLQQTFIGSGPLGYARIFNPAKAEIEAWASPFCKTPPL